LLDEGRLRAKTWLFVGSDDGAVTNTRSVTLLARARSRAQTLVMRPEAGLESTT